MAPILRRDFSVDAEEGVVLIGGTTYTLEECEAAWDAELSKTYVSRDPDGTVGARGGHGCTRPEPRR